MSNNNSEKYENNKGVYIDVHTDKKGKDHVDFYDKDPRDDSHESIHINWDSNTGKGNITDTTNGDKERTDIDCYLTTACMRHFQANFDDKCEELTILRWFRDKFVSSEDIDHYYKTAPIIVDAINSIPNNNSIYDCIYNNVIKACVNAIKAEDYDFAYNRYKNSVLALESQFARPVLEQRLVKVLKSR